MEISHIANSRDVETSTISSHVVADTDGEVFDIFAGTRFSAVLAVITY